METIQFNNLSFRYPLSTANALTEINLSVQCSEFVVICGKSGCGKSTLLRHIKKELTPYGETSGCVLYNGTDIQNLSLRESSSQIGFVLQSPDTQIVTDTVWHELAFGLENLGFPTSVIKHRVAEIANYFGIQSWFHRSTQLLSGGQKQLVSLASVMAMQPKVLILDEPTAQLDPIAAAEFLKTLKQINQDFSVTVILSEHRLEDAFPLADKVVVMDSGKIFTQGTPQQVCQMLFDNSRPHPIFWGLPSIIRLFLQCGLNQVPLSVRQAKQVLNPCSLPTVQSTPLDNSHFSNKDSLLNCKDVWFRYQPQQPPVLKGFSLSLSKGEWVSILGGNGVGKSTALKVLCGLLRPQMGKTEFLGQKQKGFPSVALVPQNPQSLFTEITVEEELFEGISHLPFSLEEKVHKTESMLGLMELDRLKDKNPYDLSGGEQQRLAIGKILLCQPQILLLDEPTKGLDPFFKRTLANILKQLQQTGICICIVSHDIEFCAEHSTRCALFFDGEIVCEENPTHFFAENYFYTTPVNKLLREWNPYLVTCEEGSKWLQQFL